MATLHSTCSKEMDCPKEVVIWNYYDHEHVVGTHYKHYERFKILAEKDDWCLVERYYKLPIINWRGSSLGYMYLENPNLIRSIQFGKFGVKLDQWIHLKDLSSDRCLVTSEYRMDVPGIFAFLQPLFQKVTAQWFINTWDEDAPMRLRRWKVWQLGFKNFVGLDYINQKTVRPASIPLRAEYPLQLPVPKTPGPLDKMYSRLFSKSIEVGGQ